MRDVGPDGLFRADDGAVVFREGPAPTRGDIADVASRVEKRMRRWLRRRGLLDEPREEVRSNEAPELSPLEAAGAMFGEDRGLDSDNGFILRLVRFLVGAWGIARPPTSAPEMPLQLDRRERGRTSGTLRDVRGPSSSGKEGIR